MAPVTFTLLFATSLMASMVKGHMIMMSPVPYGKSSLNNSPLESSGSDFPCKQRSGVYDISTMNKMAAGEEQTLSFQGSAVHGGGSCQLSVSLDLEPTKSSTFKVVKSFEGGCPGIGGGPSTLNFTIPEEIPNGKATFAWTWFNRLGNREMYMNCAPITVTGGSNSNDAYNQLPDMFVANTGDGCTTKESGDLVFPNPGQIVQKVGSGPFYDSVGSSCQKASSGSSGSSVSSVSSGTSESSAAVMAPGASSAAGTPVASTLATVYTRTTPAANANKTSAPYANSTTVAVNKPAGTPAGTPAVSTPLSSSGSSNCSQSGAIVCNGTDKFGICNRGSVTWRSVAVGTKCQNGRISRR